MAVKVRTGSALKNLFDGKHKTKKGAGIDAGFKGCITLELINSGEVPLKLYPGMRIAQLVFHEISGEIETYSGPYDCPIGPQFPRFSTKDACENFFLKKEKDKEE